MAAGDAPESEPGAAPPAVTDDCDIGVLAAGGKVFALRDGEDVQHGRENALVEGKQSGGGALAGGVVAHGCVGAETSFGALRSQAAWVAREMIATSRLSWAKSRSRTERRGWRMTSTGEVSSGSAARTASRRRRLMRLRSTALPSALGTVRPMRGPEVAERLSAGRAAWK